MIGVAVSTHNDPLAQAVTDALATQRPISRTRLTRRTRRTRRGWPVLLTWVGVISLAVVTVVTATFTG